MSTVQSVEYAMRYNVVPFMERIIYTPVAATRPTCRFMTRSRQSRRRLEAQSKTGRFALRARVAKQKKGDNTGGNADITAAKSMNEKIAETFSRYGVK